MLGSQVVRHHPAAAIVSRLLSLTRGTAKSFARVSLYGQLKLPFNNVLSIICFPAQLLIVCAVFISFLVESYFLTVLN